MRSFPINPMPSAEDRGSDLNLLQILDTLRRGKWRILSWVALMAVLAIYYAYFMATPLYKTTATVSLLNRSSEIVDLASPLSALGGDFYTINTEAEVIASRELISKLVDKLNLVEEPIFNYELRPPDAPSVLGWAIGVLRVWAMKLIQLPAEPPSLPPTPAEIREEVISAVQGAISITNLSSSYVFYITVTTEDPATSTRLANGLAEAYAEDQVAMKYKANERATAWMTRRVAELRLELEAAEQAVKTFSARAELIGPEALAGLNRQLKDRRERVTDARTTAAAADARVKALEKARAGGDPKQMAIVAKDATLNQIMGQLGVEGASTAFDARFERILERARIEALQADSKTAALERSVDELSKRVERQSTELLKVQQFEREAAASRQIYEYFLGRLKEISVQQGVHSADSRILSRALVPRVPSKPRKALIFAGAVFLGFLIGAALVLLRERRQSGFRSAQDLEQALAGLTVLGQVPCAPVTKRRQMLKYMLNRSSSAFTEAVRNLRTSIMLSNIDQPPQVIMITSSVPGEGKTTQSLALAQSFSGMEKRVLLIEGDIRRRSLQEYFRVRRQQPGLTSVVSGDLPLEDAVISIDHLGFDVLLGEKSAVNAGDFFASARFTSFMAEIRTAYDVILIDTPPVMVVSDARVIGQLADAIIYVVHWNRTAQSVVEAGVSALTSVDLKISGFSLSQINMREAKGYGGQYSEVYAGYGNRYYRN